MWVRIPDPRCIVSKYYILVLVLFFSPLAGCGQVAPASSTSPTASPMPATASPQPPIGRSTATPDGSPVPSPTGTPLALTPVDLALRWRYPTNEAVWCLAVTDLNGDGRQEVIAGSYDKHVYALTADGEMLWRYRTGAAVYAVGEGDLDGDGRPEVVVGADDNQVHAIGSNGEPLWRYRSSGRVITVLVADLNADDLDEVFAASWDGACHLLDGRGELLWHFFSDEAISVAQLADADGDGRHEIVAASEDGDVFLLDGEGRLRWRYRGRGYVRELRVYDLDSDGREEVVVGSATGEVRVLTDEGDLEWRSRLDGPVLAIDVTDMEGDGSGEIIAATGRNDDRVHLLSSQGEIKWSYQAERAVWNVQPVDVDRDGAMEVVAGADDGGVYVLDTYGRLCGSCRAPQRVHGLAVADLKGDGRNDIVARSGNDVCVWSLASGEGAAAEPEWDAEPATLSGGSGSLPGSVEAGDELIELVAVGDVMLSRTVEERMELYGASYPFAATADLLRSADIAIGNLECPLTLVGEPIDKRFTFRAHPRYAAGLDWAGFDVLNLANNHLLDFGREGLAETIEALETNHLAYVGAGVSYQDAHRPLIVEVKDRRVAFLAYAASRWKGSSEVPTQDEIAFADLPVIQEDVQQAGEQADLVVVMMHVGTEYQEYPDAEQLAVSRAAIEAGACLVIGHHSHVVQGAAPYLEGFVAYGLGNFVFDIDIIEPAREGIILRVLLGAEKVETAELVPVRIVDGVQPRLLAEREGRPIIARVF